MAQMQFVPSIQTIAGTGNPGYNGDNMAATSAQLHGPNGVALDSAGNVYIVDDYNCRVRKVTIATGVITTVAGSSSCGYSGDNGQATSAQLSNPAGVVVDAAGNLYISDFLNNRIRKVTVSTGIITTIAGTGTAGYNGDGIAATSAQLYSPARLVLDSVGNLYFPDQNNHRVRKINTSTGIITTIAGTGTAGYNGDGIAATTAQINSPNSVALDGAGNVYFTDANNERVRMISAATGIISTVAGNGTSGYSGDGGAATAAKLSYPIGVAVDAQNNIYIGDFGNSVVRLVYAADGVISTIAGTGIQGYSGDGGAATSAQLTNEQGIALDNQGNLYIADYNNDAVRKVYLTTIFPPTAIGSSSATQNLLFKVLNLQTVSAFSAAQSQGSKQEFTIGAISGCTVSSILASLPGAICTVPVTFTPSYPGVRSTPLTITTYYGSVRFGLSGTGQGPLAAIMPGIISTAAGNHTAGYTGNNGQATSAELSGPTGVAVDGAGNYYIADDANNVVRKVTLSSGVITTVAGNNTSGYSGDNGAATSAKLNAPAGVAVDAAANLYIADRTNCRIRMVTAATGNISTVAGNGTCGYSGDGGAATSGEINLPTGVAVDVFGNIFIADRGNHCIREVAASTGTISTVAGTCGSSGYSGDGALATNAKLNAPYGVSVDLAGDLFIADTTNHRIRRVDGATGAINTIAGNGTSGFSGDGGAATSAELNSPRFAMPDPAGNLFISDYGNQRVRYLNSVAGTISTVAGNGTASYSGDSGIATLATLNGPSGLAMDAIGNLYISDATNNVLRKIVVNQSAINFPTAVAYQTADTTDNPQSFTLTNLGTTALTISVPGSGSNPSVAANFVLDAATTCPQLTSSSSAQTIASGVGCTYAVDFVPAAVGSINGSVVLTDNSLATASTTQTISLTATATAVATTTSITASANPSLVGGAVIFTATVLPNTGNSVPVGTVQFKVDGSNVGSALTLSGGTATYSTSALAAGSHSVTAAYSSTSADFTSSTSSSFTQTVTKITPTITWATPAAITYGTALSATQLNATATNGGSSVPGTFVYSPVSGTVLGAGSQTLSVTFTPTDTTNYNSNTGSVTLTVNKATLTVTATNASRSYGAANPAFTANFSGFVNGDTSSVVSGAASLTTTATATSAVGSYTITAAAGTLSASNYSFAYANGTLTVAKATSSIQVTSNVNPSTYQQSVTFTVTVGGAGSGATPTGTVNIVSSGSTLLASTSLNASGLVTYTTAALPVGSDQLTVNYSGDSNYQ